VRSLVGLINVVQFALRSHCQLGSAVFPMPLILVVIVSLVSDLLASFCASALI
jgi:hypothetical protein